MDFDKNFLVNLLKDANNIYLYRLFKNYRDCYFLCDGDIKRNYGVLDEYENKIYFVDKKNLSDDIRLLIELKRITDKSAMIKDENILYEFIDILKTLQSIKNDDSYGEIEKKQAYFDLKKRVSICQAKLDLPISFFYAACEAFMDEYSVKYLNNKYKKEDYENIYDKNYDNNKACNTKLMTRKLVENNKKKD